MNTHVTHEDLAKIDRFCNAMTIPKNVSEWASDAPGEARSAWVSMGMRLQKTMLDHSYKALCFPELWKCRNAPDLCPEELTTAMKRSADIFSRAFTSSAGTTVDKSQVRETLVHTSPWSTYLLPLTAAANLNKAWTSEKLKSRGGSIARIVVDALVTFPLAQKPASAWGDEEVGRFYQIVLDALDEERSSSEATSAEIEVLLGNPQILEDAIAVREELHCKINSLQDFYEAEARAPTIAEIWTGASGGEARKDCVGLKAFSLNGSPLSSRQKTNPLRSWLAHGGIAEIWESPVEVCRSELAVVMHELIKELTTEDLEKVTRAEILDILEKQFAPKLLPRALARRILTNVLNDPDMMSHLRRSSSSSSLSSLSSSSSSESDDSNGEDGSPLPSTGDAIEHPPSSAPGMPTKQELRSWCRTKYGDDWYGGGRQHRLARLEEARAALSGAAEETVSASEPARGANDAPSTSAVGEGAAGARVTGVISQMGLARGSDDPFIRDVGNLKTPGGHTTRDAWEIDHRHIWRLIRKYHDRAIQETYEEAGTTAPLPMTTDGWVGSVALSIGDVDQMSDQDVRNALKDNGFDPEASGTRACLKRALKAQKSKRQARLRREAAKERKKKAGGGTKKARMTGNANTVEDLYYLSLLDEKPDSELARRWERENQGIGGTMRFMS